jgi:serine/threonine protein kinase
MPVRFPAEVKISEESKDFIKRCLAVDEAKRLSWEEVMKHPIFKKD